MGSDSFTNEANRVKYSHKNLGFFPGIVGFGNQRVIVSGQTSICLMQGGGKYKDEVQFVVFSKEPARVERRYSERWTRFEIDFPVEMLDDIIDALLDIKKEVV